MFAAGDWESCGGFSRGAMGGLTGCCTRGGVGGRMWRAPETRTLARRAQDKGAGCCELKDRRVE